MASPRLRERPGHGSSRQKRGPHERRSGKLRGERLTARLRTSPPGASRCRPRRHRTRPPPLARAGRRLYRHVHGHTAYHHRGGGAPCAQPRVALELLRGAVGPGGLRPGSERGAHPRRPPRRSTRACPLLASGCRALRSLLHRVLPGRLRPLPGSRPRPSGGRRRFHDDHFSCAGDSRVPAGGTWTRHGPQRHGGICGTDGWSSHRGPHGPPCELALDLLGQHPSGSGYPGIRVVADGIRAS
jgi:hypothetical protein